ncbi:MAG: class III signal peptide-containing protein [Candidatus Omnitrophica bacterium]|nr:class III signal peptide-containing protein [Candidatus Omnitrophota bacterium]MCK5492118.1 class III signal peptide-containing protein [Candidatus Omnitrophota bacterium]
MLQKLNRREKGQSTLEYIILVAGVVAILIVFLGPGGLFQTQLQTTLTDSTDDMDDMAQRLSDSRPVAP